MVVILDSYGSKSFQKFCKSGNQKIHYTHSPILNAGAEKCGRTSTFPPTLDPLRISDSDSTAVSDKGRGSFDTFTVFFLVINYDL